MRLIKEINRKVEREYVFVTGQLDIDVFYFIEKIKKGVDEKDNMSYQTNIQGKMTSYTYFNDDLKFIDIIRKFNKYMDSNFMLPQYDLKDSWGYILHPGEKTRFHEHNSVYSGSIYLNDCEQPLYFPEIKQQVIPKPGVFCIFSGWLQHGCEINDTDNFKFGLSFNMNQF
jgi:hypothetical protein